jgi:hypothetical protein
VSRDDEGAMIAAPPYGMRTGGAWLHNADPSRNSAGIDGAMAVERNLSATAIGGATRNAKPGSFGGTPVTRSFGETAVGLGISCEAPGSDPVNFPQDSFL